MRTAASVCLQLSKLETNGNNEPELLAVRLLQSEKEMANIKKETINYQNMLQQSQTQLAAVERKYAKAKRLVRDFQQREVDMVHQEEAYLQLLQEKDTEYNALVKRLKDRVISLEQRLQDTQRRGGFPVELPYDAASSLRLTPQLARRQPPKPLFQKLDSGLSDTEISDLSPDGCGGGLDDDDDDDNEGKTATVERKLPASAVSAAALPATATATTVAVTGAAAKDDLDAVVPPHDLLDNSATRSKCDLVRGRHRQVPSATSNSSSVGQWPGHKHSMSNSSSDCGLNDSDAEAISESTASTGRADATPYQHNGHAAAAAAASPPLYAQVQKDRSSGGGGGGIIIGMDTSSSSPSTAGSAGGVTGGVHHFMSHSTIPNIYKKTGGLNDGVGADASSYDSILDGGEDGDKPEQQWMYPSRVRRAAAASGGMPMKVPVPTVPVIAAGAGSGNSFADQLNQVLSEREK